ncbi:hypothetical protein E2C01_081775 [Portunus trituberculatus]|uniref:Ig-like domain-containing protein n=1 Tax=Portunus trituberculatus TaxID=210409 RepID=A0A5B7ISR4_PORTR|nr:hypothetical protein [Portunus trituberculatus]
MKQISEVSGKKRDHNFHASGRPLPLVTWWHEGSLLDDVSEETRGQVTWNTLTLPDLTRQHLHRVITCQAANSNLTQPLRSSVTLDMSCEY